MLVSVSACGEDHTLLRRAAGTRAVLGGGV